jgi:N-methylhydantoinase A
LAAQAIKKNVAQPLNLTIEEAAFTIWSTVNVDMVSAIQDITIWQGIDPREFLIVAGGGAANCHAVALAKDLSVPKLLLPKYGGVMSAVGGLVADICADFSCSCFTSTDNFNFSRVNEVLSNLEDEARLFLAKLGASQNNSVIDFFMEARYAFQVWDLSIPLKSSRISNDEDLQQLRDAFDSEHEKIFSIKDSRQSIECVHWSVRATFKMPAVKLKEMKFGGEDPSDALMPERKAYFKEVGGMVPTQIYRGDKLSYGNLLPGPAIIEEPTSSIVIPPGSKATVTKWGNYFIEIENISR